MPKVVVIPKWNIEQHCENQKFTGTLEASCVYEIVFNAYDKDGNSIEDRLVMSIGNVYPKSVDGVVETQIIRPNILFYEDGFEFDVGAEEDIDVRDIISVSKKFVGRQRILERQKTDDPDPFIFTFHSSRQNRPYKIVIGHEEYAGIMVQDERGTRTHLGYLENFDASSGIVTMSSLQCRKGLFTIRKIEINNENIIRVYTYANVIEDYDLAIAERKKAAAEKKKNANVDEEQPESENHCNDDET